MTQYEYFCKSLEEHGYKDECLLWPFKLPKHGYGSVTFNRKLIRVHRLSLAKKLGREILPGMFSLHKCRNRNCYAFAHVKEGTNTENTFDKIADGTFQEGEKHGMHKLNAKEVLEIRQLYGEHYTLKQLAIKYNVHHSTIWFIIKRVHWKNLA